MTPTPKQKTSLELWPIVPDWVHIVISIGLLMVVIFLDGYRLFDRHWSTFYFWVALYVSCFLRDRVELILYVAISLSGMMVPILTRPELHFSNRLTGVLLVWVVVLIVRDRRRFVTALRRSNNELESKVDARTSELQAINDSLRTEIMERNRIDGELRSSRQRLEDLSRQLIRTRETELNHLARELHDEFGQVLTAMKMNLRCIQRTAESSLRHSLETNISMIDQALDQVRAITLDLRPPHLDELGLAAALHWFLKQQSKIAGFQEHLSIVPPELQVSSELATVCFRIAQEAVNNSIKHAAAQRIEIGLRQEDGVLHLIIRDDGLGFDVSEVRIRASNRGSLGLISMSERASLADGKCEIESKRGYGTTIHASFPLSNSS